MTSTAHIRAASLGTLLFACSLAPSRVPLGGNYALPDSVRAGDRRAEAVESAPAQPDAAAPEPVAPVATASATQAATVESAVKPATDTIRFQPLQVGSRIKAEVTLSANAEMRGRVPAMRDTGKLSLDARLRIEIEVLKASPQSLDEIALTLTTLSMRSEFAGQSADSKQEPPATYDITLSGAPPAIRARRGSNISPVERVKLALVVVPLAEFYAHWARSPTLELKPGWSSKLPLPFAATLFTTGRNESLRVGPLTAHFTARAQASDEVPFELALPVEYSSDLGKIELDLTGSAKMNEKTGRPSAIDLSGPLSAKGGPPSAQLSFAGGAKLTGSFSYP